MQEELSQLRLTSTVKKPKDDFALSSARVLRLDIDDLHEIVDE